MKKCPSIGPIPSHKPKSHFFSPTNLIQGECCPSSHHHQEIFIHQPILQINQNYLFSTKLIQAKPPRVVSFIPPIIKRSSSICPFLHVYQNCLFFPYRFGAREAPAGAIFLPNIITRSSSLSPSLQVNQNRLFFHQFHGREAPRLPPSSHCHRELFVYCPIS